MRGKWRVLVAVMGALVLGLVLAAPVSAHGVVLEYTSDVKIEITARYDSGTPMAGAQVAVFAPSDPTTPWLTGVCDEEGRFSFVPDTSQPGIWDVQVRLAGHGGIIHIPVGGGEAAAQGNGGFTHLQIGLMAACVVWGAVGTALYFSRRRQT
jgi:nickel transport protein